LIAGTPAAAVVVLIVAGALVPGVLVLVLAVAVGVVGDVDDAGVVESGEVVVVGSDGAEVEAGLAVCGGVGTGGTRAELFDAALANTLTKGRPPPGGGVPPAKTSQRR
jgi:hypothetical protein